MLADNNMRDRPGMPLKATQFLAIVVTALALIPVGAHFFELFNKMALERDQYFTVQGIYRGWALFGIVLVGAMAANLALAVMLRRQGASCWLALLAFALIATTLAVFFGWTYPANQATENWTVIPADWERLRRQWEYSHATSAVLTFLALCCVALSVLTAREGAGERDSARSPAGG